METILPSNQLKSQILRSLVSGPKSKEELLQLPVFKNSEEKKLVGIAIEELEFERMIEKDFNKRYIIPTR